MSIEPGTRLGPYEVQSPLGAGGMGEVYRARDSKLARDVALKLLPDGQRHFPGVADRRHPEAGGPCRGGRGSVDTGITARRPGI